MRFIASVILFAAAPLAAASSFESHRPAANTFADADIKLPRAPVAAGN